MTRRFLPTAAVLAMLCAALLVPRARAAGSTRVTSELPHRAVCKTRVAPSGTVKFSDWQFPDTLNPVQSKLLVTSEVDAGIFDGLFVYDSRGHLAPVIAASVPTTRNGGITDGGKTVTIHFRHGAHWSDGSEITAQDLKFSLAAGKDSASGPYCRDTCDIIRRIDTPNRYTAVLRLQHPYAAILAYGLPVLWPHRWKNAWNNNAHAAANRLWNDTSFNFEGPNFPTNGPYQVAPGGFKDLVHVVLRPMRYYSTLTCGAAVRTMIFTHYTSRAEMVVAAAKRQTDITQNYTLADAPSLLRHRNVLHVHVQPAYSYEHLEFNADAQYKGKANPVGDPIVRAALALAIDKAQLAQSALGISPRQARDIVAWSPLINMPGLVQPFADTALHGQWDPISRRFVVATGGSRALQDAKKLLARTAFKNGFSLELLTTLGSPLRQDQVGTIAQAWGKLGVKVTPQYVSAATLFGDWASAGVLDHGRFQVAMYGSTTSPDPDELRYNLQGKYCDRTAQRHFDLNANYSCIHNRTIDAAFRDGGRTLNPGARARSYAAAQVALNKLAYWVPLYYRPQLTTDDGRVANFKPNPTQATPEWNMSQWRVRGR
ncbi:MAG: hypothetical protein NVS4B2_23740 [Chloroflexota bacterium]